MRSLLAIVALCSCTPPAGPIPGNDTGEPAVQGEVRITALDPTQGPISGGTNVTIYGEGFEGEVEVLFDSTSVAVSIFDNRTLIVTTPAVSTDMRADVTVRSDLGEFVWGNAFTYGTGGNDTGGGDTGDTDTCLLYTSPSPRDATLSRMPSSA